MRKASLRPTTISLLWLTSIGLLPAAATEKTVVVLGSSTAQGVGASTYARSWAGLLTAALTPRGWTVRNVSISGSGTAASLARFDADVTPSRPAIVVLATSIINDGMLETPEAAVPTYLRNTKALIRKTEAIGAIPIVVAPYPNDAFTESMYASIKSIYSDLAAVGVPVFDFLDGVDDGRGHWITGIHADATHPNDIGHQLLFDCIPVALFDGLLQPSAPVNLLAFGSAVQKTETVAEGYVAVRSASPMRSWTIAVWTWPAVDSRERSLLVVNSGFLQVRHAGDEFSFWSNGSLLGSMRVAGAGFHNTASTFQFATGMLRVYVDGALKAQTTLPAASLATEFTFGGVAGDPNWNATGDAFSDLLLYRAPLRAEDIADIWSSRPPWKSMEAWLPLSYSLERPYLNVVPGTGPVTVVGNWQWSAEAIRSHGPPRTRLGSAHAR